MNKVNTPNFIQANSPSELMESCLLKSIEKNSDIKFFDIQFVKNSWFAWYYDEVDLVGLLSKVNSKIKKVK